MRGLSLVAASGGHSSSRCASLSLSRPLLLWSAGSVIVAHGPSCSAACGIFPDQGSNPCALHWQANSQPLRHQGSPVIILKSIFNGRYCFPSQVSYFIDLFGVPAGRSLGNRVVQTIHFPGKKKKGHGGPLRQLGAEVSQEPTTPGSRSGHQEDQRARSFPQVLTQHLFRAFPRCTCLPADSHQSSAYHLNP